MIFLMCQILVTGGQVLSVRTRVLKGQPLTIFGDGEQTRDFVNAQDAALVNIHSSLYDEINNYR